MEPPHGEGDALPRWARYLAMPITGLGLTLLFIHLGFPYEPLVARAFEMIEPQLGITIACDEVWGDIGFFGPAIQARGVVVSRRDGDDVEIERLSLRPAWSTSWLRGQPSVYVEARTPIGDVSGEIAVGDPVAVDGSFESLDLAALPIAKYVDGLNLRGSLDAEIDLHYDAENHWIGSATLSVEDGSLGLPGQPVAIPFETLDAQLSLGPEDGIFLTIDSATLVGPMVAASASGQIARGRRGPDKIDIEFELSVVDETLRPLFRRLGLRLGDDGKIQARLGGTLANPVLR